MKYVHLTLVVPLALTAILTGCGGLSPVASTSRESTKFLAATGTNLSERSDRLPFDHSWYRPRVDLAKYKNIVVRPVTTAYLDTADWEESKSTAIPNKRAYVRRCNALARYWDKSLAKSFSSPLCVFYRTTDASQPGTLILEIALTDVRFAKPASDGDATAVGPPSCAFESRVRDAETGKYIATAADRRGPDIKVIPDDQVRPLAKPNEDICDEWAKQIMERWNPEIYPRVKRKWFSFS